MWRNHRPNKKLAQMRHAKRRANERYGLRLRDNDLMEIARMVQRGEGSFVERQSHRIALWDIVWQGVPVRIAYDSERKTPVTFLYRDRRDNDESFGVTSRPDAPSDQTHLGLRDAMSLYNAVMGENPAANELIAMLGLNKYAVPRYRDCWITADRKYIDLLTRTGGGNRGNFLDEIDALRRVAGFETDYDDEADATFMHFLYLIPAGLALPRAANDVERGPAFMMKAFEILKEHGLNEPHPNPKIEAIRQGSLAMSRRVVDAISRNPDGTIIRIGDDGKVTTG